MTGPCSAAVTSQILELDEFTRHGTLFSGGFDAYVAERELARRRAVDAYAAYEAERDKLTRLGPAAAAMGLLRRSASGQCPVPAGRAGQVHSR